MLAELGIGPGERIALVGAGGKTRLAGDLLAEARTRGWTVLFTTTTRILAPEHTQGLQLLVGLENVTEDALRKTGALCVAARWLPEWDDTPTGRRQKLGGFPCETVDWLADLFKPDLLLVEADGSHHRPLKAPAAHEPQIPRSTTLVLVLAGLSCLERPLDERSGHRPERVAALSGRSLGTRIDPASIAAVLAHPEGGRKGIPPAARAVAVLTQADARRRAAGREVARRLLRTRAFRQVLLTDLDDPLSPVEVWPRSRTGKVHAVVLAAGASQRMGRNKLLLPLGGKPLVGHAVDAAVGSQADAVWVVLGAEAPKVRAVLANRPVGFLYNRSWTDGLSSSIRRALEGPPGRGAAVLFLAGDMPFVPSNHLDRLIARYRTSGAPAIWSQAEGICGIPALFDARLFPTLRALRGDVGGRVLAGTLQGGEAEAVESPEMLRDIDSLPAYERAVQWMATCLVEA
ncbi:MAG: selenium cofactor biosynthesis protein YqeC [Chloroflexia bacterium]